MYSSKVVAKNIEKFASQEGWTPVAHSVEEVDEFKEYVNSIIKTESNSKSIYVTLAKPISKKRADEVQRFITNEQVMCAVDSNYWESRYVYIADERGSVVRFKNRKSQEIIDYILADLDEKGLSKELLVLGGRQNGTSTKILLKIMHRTLFSSNTQSMVATVSLVESEAFRRMQNAIYDNCPWWLVPQKLPKNSLNNGSALRLNSGMQATGITRGYTPQCVYVTNIEDFPNPVKTFEEGLLRAFFSSRNTMLILHGRRTNKPYSWINCLWEESKKYYDEGLARFMPVFIPWAICSDIYPTSDWIKNHPVPKVWKPLKETVEHVRRCESYIRKTSYLSKSVGPKWKMPIEQKWYWEFNYRHALATNSVDSFLSQMPADDKIGTEITESPKEEMVDEYVDLDTIFPSAAQTQKTLDKMKNG